MRHYDGSTRWNSIEADLRRQGFALRFSCATFDRQPEDFEWTGREDGWEMRRKIARWCSSHAISDYRIVRNTSYHRDLHGARTYELWTRTDPSRQLR